MGSDGDGMNEEEKGKKDETKRASGAANDNGDTIKDAGDVLRQGMKLSRKQARPIASAGRSKRRAGAIFADCPVVLCPAYAEAPIPADLMIPAEYELAAGGRLFRRPRSEDEGSKLLAESVPLVSSKLVDDRTQEHRVELAFVDEGKWKRQVVDRKVLRQVREISDALSQIGAPITVDDAKPIAQWLCRLEEVNKSRLPRLRAVAGGWHFVGGARRFVLGKEALGPDGQPAAELRPDNRGDRALATASIRRHGSRDAQLANLRRGYEASEQAAMFILASFAAPLLEPLGMPNFAVHLMGDSSKGKSTMMLLAAGLYGQPYEKERDPFVASWSSTNVGVELRASTLCDLPLCLDESHQMPEAARMRAVYMLVNGQGKTRGTRDVTMVAPLRWRTILLSSGEQALVDPHGRTGAQVRTIQFHVDDFGKLVSEEVEAIGATASQHYGHIGREWILHLLNAGPDDFRGLYDEVRATAKAIRHELPDSSLNARQAYAFALLVVTEKLVSRLFGIGTPREEVARRMAVDLTKREEVVPQHERAWQAVREWVRARPASFPPVRLRGPKRKEATSEQGNVQVYGYRNGVDGGYLLLLPGEASGFLKERGLDLRVCARAWHRAGKLVRGGGRHLTKRCSINGGRDEFYWLHMPDLCAANDNFSDDLSDAADAYHEDDSSRVVANF